MDENSLLPPIFGELIAAVNDIEQVDGAVIEAYCMALDDEESFIPELIGIIGPMAFRMLVCYYGGQSVRVPQAEEILNKVRSTNEP